MVSLAGVSVVAVSGHPIPFVQSAQGFRSATNFQLSSCRVLLNSDSFGNLTYS
jgi:hypothetical protein